MKEEKISYEKGSTEEDDSSDDESSTNNLQGSRSTDNSREDDNVRTSQQGTYRIKYSPKGLVHTLIGVARDRKIHLLYEVGTVKLVSVFVQHVLRYVVGLKIWKTYIKADKKMREYVTSSNEAFAMLILENNAEKWYEEVYEPDLDKKSRKKAIYSEVQNEGPGWSEASIERYIEIQQRIKTLRSLCTGRSTSAYKLKLERIENYVLMEGRTVTNKNLRKNLKNLQDMKRKMEGVGEDNGKRRKKDVLNMALLEATLSSHRNPVEAQGTITPMTNTLPITSDEVMRTQPIIDQRSYYSVGQAESL